MRSWQWVSGEATAKHAKLCVPGAGLALDAGRNEPDGHAGSSAVYRLEDRVEFSR